MGRQTDRHVLAGRHVAFTGRLASMSRRDALEMVTRHGGKVSLSVNRRTDVLVVGAEGWPLQPDGRVTRKLDRARRLQRQKRNLEILPEARFLDLLHVEHEDNIRRTCSIGELTEILGLPRSRIEAWQRAGLIVPTERQNGFVCFDYQQVAAIRYLHKLLAAGVPPRRLARSLGQLRHWLAADVPNVDLLPSLLPDGSRFLYRTDGGQLIEPTGQLVMEFEKKSEVVAVPYLQSVTSDATFEEGTRLEQEGHLDEAAACYRQVLLAEGPDADIYFNLANVLQAMGQKQAAIERFHDAVTIDPELTDAWNNLGNLLAETAEFEEALSAYRRAVAIEPDYADAHYGLADLLDLLSRHDEARVHWQAYLMLEQEGPWADYARSRLSAESA